VLKACLRRNAAGRQTGLEISGYTNLKGEDFSSFLFFFLYFFSFDQTFLFFPKEKKSLEGDAK
jgi:hypothetical protein